MPLNGIIPPSSRAAEARLQGPSRRIHDEHALERQQIWYDWLQSACSGASCQLQVLQPTSKASLSLHFSQRCANSAHCAATTNPGGHRLKPSFRTLVHDHTSRAHYAMRHQTCTVNISQHVMTIPFQQPWLQHPNPHVPPPSPPHHNLSTA